MNIAKHAKHHGQAQVATGVAEASRPGKITNKEYEREMERLQGGLVASRSG
jgi:hypothetical protein